MCEQRLISGEFPFERGAASLLADLLLGSQVKYCRPPTFYLHREPQGEGSCESPISMSNGNVEAIGR